MLPRRAQPLYLHAARTLPPSLHQTACPRAAGNFPQISRHQCVLPLHAMSSYLALVSVWRIILVVFLAGVLFLCGHWIACCCGPVPRSIVICRKGRQPASTHWDARVTMASPFLRWRRDVASARSTPYTFMRRARWHLPCTIRLPKGGGEFSPNLPAPVRVAVTCNVVLLNEGARLAYHHCCLPCWILAFVQT